jgi:hypothetical protein
VQGIDNERIRALSESVKRGSGSSFLSNVVLMVLAVSVGIAVGFAFMKFMWPEYFERGGNSGSGYEAGFEGFDFK